MNKDRRSGSWVILGEKSAAYLQNGHERIADQLRLELWRNKSRILRRFAISDQDLEMVAMAPPGEPDTTPLPDIIEDPFDYEEMPSPAPSERPLPEEPVRPPEIDLHRMVHVLFRAEDQVRRMVYAHAKQAGFKSTSEALDDLIAMLMTENGRD